MTKTVHVTLRIDVEDSETGEHDDYTTHRDFVPRPHALQMTRHQIDVIAERLADGYFTDDGRARP